MALSNASVPVRTLFVLLFAGSFLALAVMPLEAMLRDPAGLGRLVFFRQLASLPLVPQTVHVAVFACLTLLCAWALIPLASVRSSILIACGGAFAFGALVEGIQLFVPGREARLFDVFLNGFGVLLGCLLGCLLGLGMARKPDQI